MARYRAVLFDLDGTLLDSVRLILDSYHHTLAVHGLPPRSDEEWLQGLGTPLTVQFRRWADAPDRIAALVATYRDYNLQHHDQRVAAYPGVVEMVAAVRRRGLRTGVVTSKVRSGALRGLERIGLAQHIEVVIGADDIERPKPNPDPVLAAVERLGVAAPETLFVGDSVHDLMAGRAAGVATGAALWGPFRRAQLEPARPDHWFETPAALVTLLERT